MDPASILPNFVDLISTVVFIAIVHSGIRKGIISEFNYLFGTCCASFISVHYYERFADVLRVQFFGRQASTELLAFSVLGALIFGIFVLIHKGWGLILKIKFHKRVDRIGGAILSLMRAYFTCGLIFFVLLLWGPNQAALDARKSLSRHLFRYVTVDFYKAAYSTLIKPFFANEELNHQAFELVARKKSK